MTGKRHKCRAAETSINSKLFSAQDRDRIAHRGFCRSGQAAVRYRQVIQWLNFSPFNKKGCYDKTWFRPWSYIAYTFYHQIVSVEKKLQIWYLTWFGPWSYIEGLTLRIHTRRSKNYVGNNWEETLSEAQVKWWLLEALPCQTPCQNQTTCKSSCQNQWC